MARYQVILAYDGTEFYGFQRLPTVHKQRSIQADVEAALQRLGWQGETILSAGRTDRGAHAVGQVIAFDLAWEHTLEDLHAALNAMLPKDISALQVFEVAEDFHPRYHARARRYGYSIYCQPVCNPLYERYRWRVWPPPDLEKLQQCAALLEGTHDFCAFGDPPKKKGSTLRHVYQAAWKQEEDNLSFTIVANSFLHKMVRRLVGFQVFIGQGHASLDTLNELLAHPPVEKVKTLAPSRGLVLEEVIY